MTKELTHPALGILVGIDHGDTIQYRGIKYASLEHPFAEPISFSNPGGSTVDATLYG